MEFIKTGCSEYGNVCTYCEAHPFTGPAMQRIPQPIPDPERPCHFMDVFQTPTVDSEGKQRQPDDWQPRVNITKQFHSGELSANDTRTLMKILQDLPRNMLLMRKMYKSICNI